MRSGYNYGLALPLNSSRYQSKNGLKSFTGNEQYSDRDSVLSSRSRRSRPRKLSNGSIKFNKIFSKKTKTMDYTNYNYNNAVNRLKFLLADSYTSAKPFMKGLNEDSGDDTDNQSALERPILSDITKPFAFNSSKGPRSLIKKFKPYTPTLSKENLSIPIHTTANIPKAETSAIQAPSEIMNFIEKQEDYIEQLEKESKYCRNELSNLLDKVKDVINENEVLTEHARSDLAKLGRDVNSESSETDENRKYNKQILRKKDKPISYLSGPNIVFESRISELEAELAQAMIDLKKLQHENDSLKNHGTYGSTNGLNCELHRKQIEQIQREKAMLEEQLRSMKRSLEDSKIHMNDLSAIETSQAHLEVRHLRDELDRQHERVRELQLEMARRISEERTNAERKYNLQVDQLGGDLSSQWEQVSKLQMDLERQKRLETDLRRDIQQRNAQIDEIKLELKTKKSNFLSDIAQINAEKQSLEQEITSLHLQLDRSDRQGKIEAARLSAEINSLRQRLDRADADVLHSKRENLRLGDEIANLEKELTLGEMKNEIRPARKDLEKTIQDMQDKHALTVNELEEMVQNQKHLMDKLTNECKTLTNKLEDTSLKHKTEIAAIQSNVEYLTNRIINSERIASNNSTTNNDNLNLFSSSLAQSKAPIDYESKYNTPANRITTKSTDDSPIISERPTSNAYKYRSSIDDKPSDLSPKPTTADLPFKSSPTAESYQTNYKYPDDENKKDTYGQGEKYTANGDRSTTEPSNLYGTTPQSQLFTDKSKNNIDSTGGGGGTGTVGAYEQQPKPSQFAEQKPSEYDQYSAQGYEGYDTQQYDETAYNQEYDPQQYSAEQYDTQYDNPEQYEGYDQQQYDQTYQPTQISSYEDLQPTPQPIGSVDTTQMPLHQTGFETQPTPSTPASIEKPIGRPATGKATESRNQPRTSTNVVGPSNGGDKGSNNLSQQPTAGYKGLSSGPKN